MAGLSPKELDFATYIEQCFLKDGVLPSYENCRDHLDLASRREYDKFWGTPRVKDYLRAVGIDVDRVEGGKTGVLTPIQLLTLNTLLDFNDNRSFNRKLQQLGVNSRDFAAWKRDPAFALYYQERIAKLTAQSHEVDLALFERAIDGDVTAIKFYNELTGRYRPQTANSEVANFRILVLRVMEVLTRNLQDQPELLHRIGLELEAISSSVGDVNSTVVISAETKAIGF
jgi:hypothetical protein